MQLGDNLSFKYRMCISKRVLPMQTMQEGYKHRVWRRRKERAQQAWRSKIDFLRSEPRSTLARISWYKLWKIWHARSDTLVSWRFCTWNRKKSLRWNENVYILTKFSIEAAPQIISLIFMWSQWWTFRQYAILCHSRPIATLLMTKCQ